ncbi:MAG: AhpC/TSA family protein [Flavobacteriales bacterium]|nr:AhpC/TSA family protein [Flavobacteriales bacterium]MCB9335370.1 AhpC/TSA family protein [Flavobacteriales bacterium]
MNKNIKNLTYILASSLLIACGGEQNTDENKEPSYTINATLGGLSYQKAYLNEFKDGDMQKIDSCDIKDGHFSFSGKMDMPEVRYINFNEGKEMIALFVENSEIAISSNSLNPDSIKINGSALHTQMEGFKNDLKSYDEKLKAIVDRYYASVETATEEELKSIEAEYEKEDSVKIHFIEEYVTKNGTSIVSPYIVLRYLAGMYELAELENIATKLSKEIENSVYVKDINDRIATLKKTAIGSPAPLFSMNDAEGNPISLESFKGKYVLVDFWASWCGPCRAENPNVVAAYNKFHEKGFEIFGVSLDESKDKWIEAIGKDGLTWSHVSDLKGWENEAAKLYGVQGIPFSVLIDKEGIIIAKNLRGEDLHNKLNELF